MKQIIYLILGISLSLLSCTETKFSGEESLMEMDKDQSEDVVSFHNQKGDPFLIEEPFQFEGDSLPHSTLMDLSSGSNKEVSVRFHQATENESIEFPAEPKPLK